MSHRILDPNEPPKEESGDLVHAVLVGVAIVVVFGLGGFMLMRDQSGSMGTALFVLLPIVTGFGTALLVRGRNLILASLLLGVLICTGILLLTKMEGWVCVLMSSPLIAFGLTIGALLGVVVRNFLIAHSSRKHLMTLLMLAVLPFFPWAQTAWKRNREERRARRLSVTHSLSTVRASSPGINSKRSIRLKVQRAF